MLDQMRNIYRLVWYATDQENKWSADYRREYLGSAESILALWLILTKSMNCIHVEVYGLDGSVCEPEKGIDGLY